MTRTARLLVGLAALLMATAYALPLWRVGLVAPQYPEGLGMLIKINTVIGVKEQDLNSINGLNHYIGMKKIEPDTIPELKFMPIILGVLVAGGLLVALAGRRWALFTWAGAFGTLCIAGLVDFWKWEYSYGHDLDMVNAIIKIPGMNYQPPLIGSKQLLNFTATSWPASGGWLLITAALIAAYVVFISIKRPAIALVSGRQPSQAVLRALSAALFVLLASCSSTNAQPIALNEDGCEFCRMTISDARFGGEAIAKTGRARKFDSVECLASFVRTAPANAMQAVYVIDLQHPGTFVPAASAGFLRASMMKSPMGRSVVAFATPAAAEAQRTMLGGEVLSWAQLLADTVNVRADAR